MPNKKILAIIPARGGSKRIPRKNIKDFLGKPIIAYSIAAATNSGLFDEVMVSTDDKEIATIAKKYGAKVPYLRSKKNSKDYSSTEDVIEEVLNNYEKIPTHFDIFCCIYPTAPLIKETLLKECLDLLVTKRFDSVFPVVKYGYPIQRSLKMIGSKVGMIWPENMDKRSQDLRESYHDSGQFYWMWTDKFLKNKKFFEINSGAIIVPDQLVQDIDTLDDWEMAALKYKNMFRNKHKNFHQGISKPVKSGDELIVVLGGGLKKTTAGKWRTTTFSEGDSFGIGGDRLRVLAAYNLYKMDPKRLFLVSGGKGQYKKIPGVPNVAEVLKEELVSLHVPASQILVEKKSGNTLEQLLALQDMIKKKEIVKTVTLISNRHHLPRIKTFISFFPGLLGLRKQSNLGRLKLMSAESVLLKENNKKWKNLIDSAYASRAMKKRLILERRGIKQIKDGTYNFQVGR